MDLIKKEKAMKIFSCPHCNDEAISLSQWGNPLFFFNPQKRCKSCNCKIALNLNLLFFLCFISAVIAIGSIFLIVYLAHRYFPGNQSLSVILWFAFLVFIGFIGPYIVSGLFKLSLISSIDNEETKNKKS